MPARQLELCAIFIFSNKFTEYVLKKLAYFIEVIIPLRLRYVYVPILSEENALLHLVFHTLWLWVNLIDLTTKVYHNNPSFIVVI